MLAQTTKDSKTSAVDAHWGAVSGIEKTSLLKKLCDTPLPTPLPLDAMHSIFRHGLVSLEHGTKSIKILAQN